MTNAGWGRAMVGMAVGFAFTFGLVYAVLELLGRLP